MRKRLKKNCRFTWDKQCQQEFENLKSSFTKAGLSPSQLRPDYKDIHVWLHINLDCPRFSCKVNVLKMQNPFASCSTTDAEFR